MLVLQSVFAVAPRALPEYWLPQLTFVLIYAIVGLGLMLLAGFTGLFSLGHAAFLGVGAYTEAVLTNAGWPFPASIACAGLLSAAVGMVGGLPALRVKGIYLGMATLAFGFIVEEGLARWEHVTGGNAGLVVNPPAIGGWTIDSTEGFYFLCLVLCVGATLAIVNLLRAPTGRAFVAIRDSEISAQSMGIHLARYKTLSFALSAALAGIGGALYAHKIQFLWRDLRPATAAPRGLPARVARAEAAARRGSVGTACATQGRNAMSAPRRTRIACSANARARRPACSSAATDTRSCPTCRAGMPAARLAPPSASTS